MKQMPPVSTEQAADDVIKNMCGNQVLPKHASQHADDYDVKDERISILQLDAILLMIQDRKNRLTTLCFMLVRLVPTHVQTPVVGMGNTNLVM